MECFALIAVLGTCYNGFPLPKILALKDNVIESFFLGSMYIFLLANFTSISNDSIATETWKTSHSGYINLTKASEEKNKSRID